jgi:hypothetical protein
MLIAYVPALFAIIGLLLYVLASNAKVQRIGEHMYWTGLLVTLMTLASATVKIP